jgi:hypothetical protein
VLNRLVFYFYLIIHAAMSFAMQAFEVFSKDQRQGLLNEQKEVVIPAVYDQLGWTDGTSIVFGDLIGYELDGKWGLISTKNKVLSKPVYYRLQKFDDHFIKASIKGSFSNLLFNGLIDQHGKVVLSCNYFEIEPLASSFILSNYQSGQISKGLYNDRFEEIIPIHYQSITPVGKQAYAAQNFEGKWKFYLINGESTQDEFDDYSLGESKVIVRSRGKYGSIDYSSLKTVDPIEFKSVMDGQRLLSFDQWEVYSLGLDSVLQVAGDSIGVKDDLFITHINGNQEVVIEGKTLFDNQEVELKYASDGFLIVEEKYSDQWKLLTTSGNLIIDAQDSLYFDGIYFATLKESKWQIFNRFGRKLSIKSFDAVGKSISNYMPVKRLGYWTLMDFQGELITQPKFDSILGGGDNRFIVKYLGSTGVLSSFGEWIIDPIYDEVEVNSSQIVAKNRNVYYVFDLLGEVLFTLKCDQLISHANYLAFQENGYWGMVKNNGEIIADAIYNEVGDMGDFLYGRADQYVSLFQPDGRQLVSADDGIQQLTGTRGHLYRVMIDQRVGYIDANAKLRIANRYEDGALLSENRIAIKLLGKWGYIDQYEQLVIQPVYEEAGIFENGLAIVKQNGLYGLIDQSGNEIFPVEYKKILHKSGSGYVLSYANNQWGAADKNGRIILTPNYLRIQESSNGLLLVNRNGKWGIIDQFGYTRMPFVYDHISQFGDYLLMKKSPKK